MKKKMMASKDERCAYECGQPEPHPYGRGKALFAVAVGILLIFFGFKYIDLNLLAMVVGVLYTLKGVLRLMGNW